MPIMHFELTPLFEPILLFELILFFVKILPSSTQLYVNSCRSAQIPFFVQIPLFVSVLVFVPNMLFVSIPPSHGNTDLLPISIITMDLVGHADSDTFHKKTKFLCS